MFRRWLKRSRRSANMPAESTSRRPASPGTQRQIDRLLEAGMREATPEEYAREAGITRVTFIGFRKPRDR